MADSKDKKKPSKPVKATIPPRSTLPPRAGAVFGRPMAATPAQREKRRNGRPSGTISAKKTADEGEIMLFGSIGQDWFGEGITAVSFDEQLKSLGSVETIRLRINSGGGDVFEATAIYNMLVKSDAKVIVEIEGVAASAATLISMAGDEVRISENAHFMIHAASGVAWGNAEQIRQYLKLLDNADGLIRATYAGKTGMDDSELAEMMAFDNWMTAQEALDNGFVDAIDGVKKVKPHVTPEDSVTPKHIGNLTDDRLAAFGGYLSTLAAAVCPTSKQEPGSSPQPVPLSTKESKMNAKLRAKCLAAGMPESLTGDAANEWLDANFDKVMTPTAVAVAEPPPKASDDEKLLNLIEAREKKRLDARKSWRKEVDANISLAFGEHVPAGLKEQCYDLEDDGDARIDGIRAKIQAAKAAEDQKIKDGGVRISFDRVQPRDNYRAAIKSGLMVRCLSGSYSGSKLEALMPEKDRAKDYQDFAGMHLVKIAENCLLADGWRDEEVRRLSPMQIAQAALGFGRNIGVRNEAGLMTTGSLAEVTRDAMNKVLTTAYNEAPQTWRLVGRQGASVADFKDKHVVKLSGAQNVPIWNDNTIPELAKLSNEKEKYAVEARAETLSFSWRLFVNDDMDALSRGPQIRGNAMARTVNAVFWAQITSNPVMADGQTLFLETPAGNRKQSNRITGANAPSNSTIGSMRKLMRLMRGLNTPEGAQSDDILNLSPKFLVGGAALEEVILKQTLSGADPASGGNSAVYNSSRVLTPVIEPLLDANSTTAYYVFADPATIDTVELSFMQGQETPYTHEWMDDRTMSQNFTILQTFNAKAIEWRSMIRHDGA